MGQLPRSTFNATMLEIIIDAAWKMDDDNAVWVNFPEIC